MDDSVTANRLQETTDALTMKIYFMEIFFKYI